MLLRSVKQRHYCVYRRYCQQCFVHFRTRDSEFHIAALLDGFSAKPPKSNKPRTVVLLPDVAAALRRHRREMIEHCLRAGLPSEEALLVGREDGGRRHPATFSKNWGKLMERLGVKGKANFHVARYTAIALMLQAGVNPRIVSEFAGHASVGFTLERYGHYVPNLQTEVVGKLEAFFGRQSA